jgi:hypothetical protein
MGADQRLVPAATPRGTAISHPATAPDVIGIATTPAVATLSVQERQEALSRGGNQPLPATIAHAVTWSA